MKLKNTIGFALMAEHNIVTSVDTVKINDYNELVVGDRIVHDLGPQYTDSITNTRKYYYATRSSDAVLNSKHSGHSSLTKDCRVQGGLRPEHRNKAFIVSDETPISKSHFAGIHLREWLDEMRARLGNIRERAAEISQGLIVQSAPTNRGASMHMINMVAGAGGRRELQVHRTEPLVLGDDRYEYTKMGVRDKHARDFQPWMRG